MPRDSFTMMKAMINDMSKIKYTADSVKELSTKHLTQVEKLIEKLKTTTQENLYYYITTFIGLALVGYGLLYWRHQQKVLDEILFYQRAIIELDYNQKLNPTKHDPTKYRRST